MNKAKINELYEKAYVTYEVPYEASVVEPGHIAIHKQKVWDRYLFAELIVKETLRITGATPSMTGTVKKHFGVEE